MNQTYHVTVLLPNWWGNLWRKLTSQKTYILYTVFACSERLLDEHDLNSALLEVASRVDVRMKVP